MMIEGARKLRVLIVEDSEDDCRLLLRELARGGYDAEHARVDTPEDLHDALRRSNWDIVFGDYSMPHMSGSKALQTVRAHSADVPFIFVSGTIGEDTAVAAMKSGAQDYIMKGNMKRLLPAVERELREAEGRRERARVEAERRAADARFRNILTLAADAIVSFDERQQILVFNKAAEASFGYAADEVLGQPLSLLIAARCRAGFDRAVDGFARAGDAARRVALDGDLLGRRKDGSEFPAEASISKVVEGGAATYTVIVRDITDRKRAEEQLRLLQSVTQAVSEAGDVHAALSVALGQLCEAAGWSFAQAWLPRGDGAAIECSPAWYCREAGFDGLRIASLGAALAPGEGLAGRVWATRAPCWLHVDDATAHLPIAEIARDCGLAAAVGVPVLAAGEVIAVLEFHVRTPREDDERRLGVVAAIAEQVGSVIQRKRTEERLNYLAHHDALTGLPNRVLFHDRLTQLMAEAHRHRRLLAVVFLDLDRFKTINDSLGHGIGDQLLQSVAARLARCVREGDTVARLSGDEFAVILADIRAFSDAAPVAQKILGSFSQPFYIGGQELYTSASLGVTVYPLDSESAESLLRNADIAMYRAKKQGGNSYQFYAAEMTERAMAHMALESALRHAVDRDELEIYYQPLVDLESGSIVGAEALLRWNHPERGIVLPSEFIGLAEETGLIGRIGEWAARTACRQAAQWPRGEGQLRLAVNVSPSQFEQPDFADIFLAIADETGFDLARLDIEITESLLMRNADAILTAMRRLSHLGVQFVIDDFGTGYSSLSYLRRFPISRIKIDRSFVREIPTSKNDSAIVRAIISIARSLNIAVAAEGVESEAQLAFLRAQGCDLIQGFLSGHAVNGGAFAGILRDRAERQV